MLKKIAIGMISVVLISTTTVFVEQYREAIFYSFLVPIFEGFKAVLSASFAYLSGSVVVAGWTVVGLVVLATGFLVLTAFCIWGKCVAKKKSRYFIDAFGGWIWRFKWNSYDDKVGLPTAFCPRDDMEVSNARRSGEHCEKCKYTPKNSSGSIGFIAPLAGKEFERRYRSGEWKLASIRVNELKESINRREITATVGLKQI